MHRALKTGQMSLEELYSVSKFTAKQTSGMDYRDAKFKKDEESMETFDCANCHRPVHALRYAPHLDKCMGLGRRTGSRVISYATQDFSSKVDPPSNVDGTSWKSRPSVWRALNDMSSLEDYVPLGAQSSSSMKDQE